MKKILIISIAILLLAGCSFGNKKIENQKTEQKEGDTIVKTENTPAVETSKISNTEVIQYAPPEILPKNIKNGSCWTNSLATSRSDAWRCLDDNFILDPCFSLSQSGKVICPNNPAKENDAIVLKLDKPLPEPDIEYNFIRPYQGAWYVELRDGSFCLWIVGASAFVGDERANYLCESGGYLMGELREGEIWTAKKAVLSEPDPQSHDFTIESSEDVSIKKAWQ
jgi:hypothetical protein